LRRGSGHGTMKRIVVREQKRELWSWTPGSLVDGDNGEDVHTNWITTSERLTGGAERSVNSICGVVRRSQLMKGLGGNWGRGCRAGPFEDIRPARPELPPFETNFWRWSVSLKSFLKNNSVFFCKYYFKLNKIKKINNLLSQLVLEERSGKLPGKGVRRLVLPW